MNSDQEAHAAQVADEVQRRLVRKYTKGAIEHGSMIWEYSPLELCEMAIDEAIDQCVYLLTLKQSLENYSPTDLGGTL